MGRISHQSRARGFTLIELMAVVIIVGILAVVGLVSYRRFINSSRTSEAVYMVGSIRSAEESYRAETLQYKDVSPSITTYYPRTTPDNHKSSWDTNRTDDEAKKWKELGVRPDGPVVYGYAVKAGGAGGTPPSLSGVLKAAPAWPSTPEPWYVVLACGDIDAKGEKSYVVGSSFTGEIYVENEGE
jgi:prepilin-type N-terminal cleavage/methylation domain-containing protein